jgi:hypothetical protein
MTKKLLFQKGLIISLICICSIFLVFSAVTTVQAALSNPTNQPEPKLPCLYNQCGVVIECIQTNFMAMCPLYCQRPDGTWFCNGGYYCTNCK